jgi:POT family proton-dependent oligopeptide transporter
MTTLTANKQPKGVYALFNLQLLGMIGFSILFSLIVLYCTNRLGFSNHSAYAISAAFNALAFATSVPGGYLAEKYLGYYPATVLSTLMTAIGILIMAMPGTTSLYIGLGVFLMGTGMIIPCLFVLLGNLYPKHHPSREGGFVLAYVGMNVGSFIASALSGSLIQWFNYPTAFILGAAFTFVMLPILFSYKKVFTQKAGENDRTTQEKLKGYFLTGLCVIASIVLVDFANVCNSLLLILGVASLLLVVKIALGLKSEQAKKKLLSFVLLTLLSIAFWALYSLAPSVLTIFTEKNVNRDLFGWVIPTADLSCLNPLFIIIFGPLSAMLWKYLKKKNIQLSTYTLFSAGILLMGSGYYILTFGISLHSANGHVALAWLVLSYFLQTIGELCVGPIGYAMVGELVPTKFIGLMMGIWQLSSGVAGALSEYLANLVHYPQHASSPLVTNASYSHAFSFYGLSTMAIALVTLAIVSYKKNLFSKIVITKSDIGQIAESS